MKHTLYTFDVEAVWAHEAAMKEQAKKMNVESLRQNAESEVQNISFFFFTLNQCWSLGHH